MRICNNNLGTRKCGIVTINNRLVMYTLYFAG